MKRTIKLKNPLKIDDKELNEITLDFDKLTGADILAAEKNVNLKYRENFQIYSLSTHIEIAAIACGIVSEDLANLDVHDFLDVTGAAQIFLIKPELLKESSSEESQSQQAHTPTPE